MIIGITGTNGAGKETIVESLKEKGFEHYSVRSYLENILLKEGKNTEREDMIQLANELREKHGPQYIVEQLYNQATNTAYSIIESLRCPGEIEYIQQVGEAHILAIDADRKKRYNRISKRKSSTDLISEEEFIRQEKLEYENLDPFKQNLKKCIEMSDYVFDNNGTILELNNKIDYIIGMLHR